MSWPRGGVAATHNDVAAVVANMRGDTFDVRDYGATGDGITDDTSAVQAAFTAAKAAGGGTVYFPSGTFLVNTIYVTGDHVYIRGAGVRQTTVRRKAGTLVDVRVFAYNYVDRTTGPTGYQFDIRISGLTIDGNNANVTSWTTSSTSFGTIAIILGQDVVIRDVYILNPRENGISIISSINVDIDGCTVDGMVGDSALNQFQLQGDAYNANPGYTYNTYPLKFVRIRGCHAVNNAASGGVGFCIQAGSEITIVNCTADMSATPAANGYGIILEAGGVATSSMVAKNVVIADCVVSGGSWGLGALDSSGQSDTTGIMDGVTITGNEVDNCVTGIVATGTNCTVTGNSVSAGTCLLLGVNKVSHEQNFVVSGNTFRPMSSSAIATNKGGAGGVLDGLTITGNIIDGGMSGASGTTGIILGGAIHNFVISNNIIRNTAGSAVYLNSVSSGLQNQYGRIIGNLMVNAVTLTSGVPYPYNYVLAAAGVTDVLVALNYMVGGAGAAGHLVNTTTPYLTVFANQTTGGVAVSDDATHSVRLAGTVTGSRGGNAAMASLLTQLAGIQAITDSTTT